MKYLKLFENKEFTIRDFLEKYEKERKSYGRLSNSEVISKAKNYKIPEIFYDEFSILNFLYEGGWNWKTGYKKEDTYIKNQVKKYVLDLVLQKFEKDPNSYFELKEVLKRKFNDRSSFDLINSAGVKYAFFLFQGALKRAPEWITNTTKYNL